VADSGGAAAVWARAGAAARITSNRALADPVEGL